MRTEIQLDRDWRFFRGDLAPRTNTEGWGGAKAGSFFHGAAAPSLDDSGWRTVHLPHDFVHEGDFVRKGEDADEAGRIPDAETIDSRHFGGGSLSGSVAWYRKRFSVTEEDAQESCYTLICDGIYRNSTVYLNGHFIGTNESGYIGFAWDVSDYIYTDRENVLAVRVDATGREGWWYEGGGICRTVRLVRTGRLHVKTDGVYVMATPRLSGGRSASASAPVNRPDTADASLLVETTLINHREEMALSWVRSTVFDEKGNNLTGETDELDILPWGEGVIRQQISLPDARLWSPERTALYTVRTEVISDSSVVDTVTTRFGVRSVAFDAERGLLLNGQPYRVKGFCVHDDHAGVGIALPGAVHAYRIRRMKELGANAVRCAHNPPDPQFLALCDEMGMLVMDETRKTSVSTEGLSQFRRMILRDRNHPSIFCWSVGNEEVYLQRKPEARRVVRSLRMEAHLLDPARPVTMALVYWDPEAEKGHEREVSLDELLPVVRQLDAAGFNYQPERWDEFRSRIPDKPLMCTEAHTGAWTRGCYATDIARGRFYRFDEHNAERGIPGVSGDNRFAGLKSFRMYMERQDLSGYFLWTAFDYRGEPTPMPWPAVSSQFGVMDSCGFDKDIAWFYRSWWREEPVLHLFPGGGGAARAGETDRIYCFSNLEEVELFAAGESLGRKRMEPFGYLVWEDVICMAGTLSAIGYREGREVLQWREEVCGTPERVELEVLEPAAEGDTGVGSATGAGRSPVAGTALRANGRDCALIGVRIVDGAGRLVENADPQIRFAVSGAGELLGTGNGDPGSHESDVLPVRRAFGGRCQLIVRAATEPGELVIRAESEGLRHAEYRMSVAAGI